MAHETRADGPEECAVILRNSMIHGQHVLRLPALEKYSAWYYSRSLEEYEDMYKLYKAVLQIMAFGEGKYHSAQKGITSVLQIYRYEKLDMNQV